ncbi:MAG: hypothetical protein E6J70_12760 [Deltaproteobacteria bacterium]|nr:MAG: hypothetical protein E6J70_12760 [Deltaproteobacteria bacterium]
MNRAAVALGMMGAALSIAAAVALGMEVQVVSVRAAERGPSDAELQPLRGRLRRLVGYRSFRVVQQERRQCSWRNTEEFAIPGGRLLRVLPKGMQDQAVMMQVRLLDGRRRLVDTDIRLRNRGTMLLGVGRQAGRADGALIIMLKAEAQ